MENQLLQEKILTKPSVLIRVDEIAIKLRHGSTYEDELLSEIPWMILEPSSYEVIQFYSSKLPRNYIALLYSRWLRSFRFGNPLYRKVSSHQYYKHYHAYIEKLLSKPDSITRLAVLSDDKDVALGFSVSREDVLDYIHVHTNNRHIGIGTALIPDGITTFTHITAIGLEIWNKHYKDWEFNPFA